MQLQIVQQITKWKRKKIVRKLSSKEFDVVYPGVGENLTFLKEAQTKENLSLNYILRSQDLYCYQFSNKGFFNFKKHIPKIISEFKLN